MGLNKGNHIWEGKEHPKGMLGKTPWNKDKHIQLNTGRTHFKKGYKPWNKGTKGIVKPNSGSFKKGHKSWLGKIRSEDDKKKMSKGHKLNPTRYWLGKKLYEETKQKMRKKRAKQILPKYDTKIEVKIQNFLKTLGIDFFTHQYINIKHGYQCDILIPFLNMVIECDGVYWHKYPVGKEIDHIRTKELIEKGFKVLRLWEFEINGMNIQEFKNRLGEK